MTMIKRSFAVDADETRQFLEHSGQLEVINTVAGPVGRATFHPGWSWSKHVGPIMKTDLCMAAHTGYVVSGRLTVVMADTGERTTYSPGDLMIITPGHDAWTEGQDPCVVVDWTGCRDYAKPATGGGT